MGILISVTLLVNYRVIFLSFHSGQETRGKSSTCLGGEEGPYCGVNSADTAAWLQILTLRSLVKQACCYY